MIETSLASKEFVFSISEHTRFLAGYLDAVGRVLTSNEELVAISARLIKDESEAEEIVGGGLGKPSLVENWSREFGALVEGLLGADQRSRLGFYLIEYICWFEAFTGGAICHKFDCNVVRPLLLSHATYVLNLEKHYCVLITATRSSKPDMLNYTGLKEIKDETGHLLADCEYLNGSAHGRSRAWTRDGVLREEAFYRDGNLHGIYRSWWNNGNLKEHGEYRDGHRICTYRWFLESGDIWQEHDYGQ